MRRSYQSTRNIEKDRAYSKGQWFLISAVVATGAFLVISGIFKTYFIVDPSSTAMLNEERHFQNIREQFQNIIMTAPCTGMSTRLLEFKSVSEHEMASKGYLLKMNYTYVCGGVRDGALGLVIASSRGIYCQNTNTDSTLPSTILVECSDIEIS